MSDSFRKHVVKEINYYTIDSFSDTDLVIHAFSGRNGGVSKEKYASLNLSILTKDSLENIRENRRRFAEIFDISPSYFVGAHQVHKDNIYQVTVTDRGRGALTPDTVIPETDALITNERGIPLMAFFADCVPVFFLDPIKKVIAITHAGWRGTVAKIAAKTARVMQEDYQSRPQDILAAVGPSIGPCHYEVDLPVISKVKEAFPYAWERLLTNISPDGHANLNLWETNVEQLNEVGVLRQNITVAGLCTYCNDKEFFSHRRGMAGRQSAIIMLK